MGSRMLWPVTLALAAGGMLAAHALAYRLSGEPAGGLHEYLAHAPQVLLVLGLPAALLAVTATRGTPRPAAFALLGTTGFVVLEHAERLGQGGLPWLLTRPAFLLGLVLQLPFALGAWLLARSLVGLEVPPARRPRRLPAASLRRAVPVGPRVLHALPPRPRLRGPPGAL